MEAFAKFLSVNTSPVVGFKYSPPLGRESSGNALSGLGHIEIFSVGNVVNPCSGSERGKGKGLSTYSVMG